MKILVVEDNKELLENIRKYLELEGYQTEGAMTGHDALNYIDNQDISCVILDLNLPDRNGLSICKEFRERGNKVPIIILTARVDKLDVVTGFNLGADDYIRKPFEFEELLVRVNVQIKREVGPKNPIVHLTNHVYIDRNKRTVYKNKQEMKLSPKEYKLLDFLAENKNIAKDRVSILEAVWGEDSTSNNAQTVDVHIAYIRRKLGKDIIKTSIGGYLMEINAN